MGLNSVVKAASKNKSLTCLVSTLVGLGVTVYLTAKASCKATRELDKAWMDLPSEEKEDKEDFTLVEKAKITWKFWIPPLVSATGTAVMACLGYKYSRDELKAITALYSASEASAVALQNKLLETVGKKKTEEIMGGVAKDEMDQHPDTERNTKWRDYIPDDRHCRFYDSLSGRYFWSTVEKVRGAMVGFNRELTIGPAKLNDLYDRMDLPRVDMGDLVGYKLSNLNDQLEFVFYPEKDNDDYPCLWIKPDREPKPISLL